MIQAPSRVRHNSPAELQAFDTVCERLGGFNPDISFEWVDGFLAALAAGPRLPEPEEWLPLLCGDAFERTFADPADADQALRALQVRLKVLCEQLDPAALMDDPQALRLDPLMAEWTDADRARLMEEEQLSAEDAAAMQTGALWAEGFLDAVEAFPAVWQEPSEVGADEEAVTMYGALLAQISALLIPPGHEEYVAHVAEYFPQGDPTRDELLAEACWAAQDLRVFWVDHAPRPTTRRVEATPGRNDPCHCGSGKKFKKCHGAAGAEPV